MRNIHQIIASAMKLAKEQKIIATDPTEGCALPKLEHREMKTLPVEQLTSFLRRQRTAASSRCTMWSWPPVSGGASCWASNGKTLTWTGSLRVKRQIARIDGEIIEAPLKTKNAYRTLPLAEDTIQVLQQQKKNRQQSLGVPIDKRRSHLSGQCAPYAPPGAEAGGAASGQVPRSAAHLRNPGPSEWSGHQDSVRNAGALLRRLHPGHLCPCHHSGPEGGGQDHGESPDIGPLNMKKIPQKQESLGAEELRQGAFFAPYGSRFGSTRCPGNGDVPKSCKRAEKSTAFRPESGAFVVAGAGLEPTTSGL